MHAPARGGQAVAGPLLLGVATLLLVAAVAFGALSAHQVRSADVCSRTTHLNVMAPVLLSAGGFLALMALVSALATAGARPRGRRRRRGLFLTVWILVAIAFAVSALGMYVVSTVAVCL